MAQARCSRRRQPATGIGGPVLKDLLEGNPLRHPIHPMLVHFPIGFLVVSFLLDLVSLGFPEVPNLVRCSFYAMLFGVVTALLAAVPGFVDYSDIRRDHAGKATATRHMTLNLMVVAIYGINLWLRSSALTDFKISLVPLLLSLIGIVLLSASGYLGGRLVYDEGISVGRHKRRTPTPVQTLHFTARENGEVAFVPIPEAEHLGEKETLRVQINGEVITIAK